MPNIVNNYTNEQLASAAYKDTGAASDEVPLNSDLGTASLVNVGTASTEIPLNSDLGTASTANVQTSPTDTTAGALMAVGAFGDGATITPNWPTGDLHDVVGSGKYYTSTALNKPTSAGWVQNDTRSTDYIRLTWTSAIDGSKWVQEKIAGTWSAWKRIDPQAFGWGVTSQTALNVDADTMLTSGSYYLVATSTNLPAGADSGELLVGALTSTRKTHTFKDRVGRVWSRAYNGVWSAWQPVYTGANYQPESKNGLNVARMMANKSGGAIADGAIVDDSVLRFASATSAGALISGVAPTGGSYKSVVGASLANNAFGYFTKVSG